VYSLVVVDVYIPPPAKATAAIGALAGQITAVENTNPDSVLQITYDLNHTTMSKDLPM